MLIFNTFLFRIEWRKIPRYIAENFEIDVGDFIPEFSVTDMFWSAGSVTCGGLSNTFCHSVKLLLPPLDIRERATHSTNRKQGMPTEIVGNRFSLIREF
jgi:hypothetical protein